MIVSCQNCKKKFNIDQKLIPDQGRLLQCSGCNHRWYYKKSKNINLNEDDIVLSEDNEQIVNNNKEKLINKPIKNIDSNLIKKKTNDNSYEELKTEKKEKKITSENILNILFVLIITFVAFILILDTFKIYIANYIPVLYPLLDSLYETLIDIKSFIINLIY